MIRFYSYLGLLRFLQGLCTIGYEAPLIDPKQFFLERGYNRDIHLYSCDVIFTPDVVILTFNTPMSKHKADSDYVSNYLPPLQIYCKKVK